MAGLTRRELLIAGTAIAAACALPRAAFAAETAEQSGFPRDTNRKGEHSMTTIITLKNCPAYIREWITRERNQH